MGKIPGRRFEAVRAGLIGTSMFWGAVAPVEIAPGPGLVDEMDRVSEAIDVGVHPENRREILRCNALAGPLDEFSRGDSYGRAPFVVATWHRGHKIGPQLLESGVQRGRKHVDGGWIHGNWF